MEPINQYEIIWVNLDATIGSEMKKTRPCVVLSPDEMNKYLQTIVIAPLTSNFRRYPTRVEIKQKQIKGSIVLDQICTIDRKRVIKKAGLLTSNEIEKVKQVLMETYVA